MDDATVETYNVMETVIPSSYKSLRNVPRAVLSLDADRLLSWVPFGKDRATRTALLDTTDLEPFLHDELERHPPLPQELYVELKIHPTTTHQNFISLLDAIHCAGHHRVVLTVFREPSLEYVHVEPEAAPVGAGCAGRIPECADIEPIYIEPGFHEHSCAGVIDESAGMEWLTGLRTFGKRFGTFVDLVDSVWRAPRLGLY